MTQKSPPPSGRATRGLGAVYSFFNSPLGLIVAGFLFTGVLGVLVTHAVDNYYKKNELHQAEIAAHDAQVRKTSEFINSLLAEKALYLRLLEQEIDIKNADRNIGELWNRYLSAYEKEYKGSWDIEAGIRSESYRPDERWRLFSDYYLNTIDSAFSKLDGCAYDAFSAYSSASGAEAAKTDSAKRVLAGCNYENTLAWLENCLGTYSFYYHVVVRESEATETEKEEGATAEHDKATDQRAWCERRPQAAICRLDDTYAEAKKYLSEDCNKDRITAPSRS